MTTLLSLAAWFALIGTAAFVLRHRAIQRAMRDHPDLRTYR